jgi:hypothetical protein
MTAYQNAYKTVVYVASRSYDTTNLKMDLRGFGSVLNMEAIILGYDRATSDGLSEMGDNAGANRVAKRTIDQEEYNNLKQLGFFDENNPNHITISSSSNGNTTYKTYLPEYDDIIAQKWGTKGVFDSSAVALISNEYVEVKDTAQFTIFGSVGILDSRTRERTTITANIYIYDSSDALKRRYTLGSMYLRDDDNRFDSGIISGHAMLELTAGDKIALAVRRLDAQNSDATFVHPAETRLLIERIDYELV